jgi:hypothetical protein
MLSGYRPATALRDFFSLMSEFAATEMNVVFKTECKNY